MSEELKIPQNGMIDFYADWCPPCKQMDPILKELSENYNIEKVNVEENALMAKYFDVISIPTFVLIKEGKEAKRITGATSKQKLEEALKEIYSEL